MHFEASLSRHDLINLFAEILPLTLHVGGPDQFITFFEPEPLELVAGTGLRLVCKARVSWPVLGIAVPVAVNRVAVRVRPEIVEEGSLAFRFSLEHADFAFLPNVVDRSVTDKINAELVRHQLDLAWPFRNTFGHAIALPTVIEPRMKLELNVAAGDVSVTDQSLSLTIAFHAHISRGTKPAEVAPEDPCAPIPRS